MRRLLFALGLCVLSGGLLAACDADAGEEEAVDLPAGTFELTVDGATERTLAGTAGFATYRLPDTLSTPGLGETFAINLAPEVADGPSPIIQLLRLSGGQPRAGAYAVAPTSLTGISVGAVFGSEAYFGQAGTVRILSSTTEVVTGRFDATLGTRGDATLRMEGAFHALRDTSLEGFGFTSPGFRPAASPADRAGAALEGTDD